MQVATSPTALIEGGAPSLLRIPALENGDLADVIAWARSEQCALGQGDVANYRHTDAAAVGLCGGRRDAEDVSGQPAGGSPGRCLRVGLPGAGLSAAGGEASLRCSNNSQQQQAA